jgi:hypothetical protein
MDYVEALTAIAESLGDIRRRLIALEVKVEHLDGDTPSQEDLIERIESLEEYDWQSSWEPEVESLIDAAIESIDLEDKIRDALRSMSISLSID